MLTRPPSHLRSWLIAIFLPVLISLTAIRFLFSYYSQNICGAGRTESYIAALAAAAESYRHDLDWPPKSFANPHIVTIFGGDNPHRRVFFEFSPRDLSPAGEFLDEWDTPFRFDPPADNIEAIRITSAGEDRTFGTKDDIKSY